MLAGGTVTATLTLSSPAPAGGTVVNLVSRDPTVVTLPGSVTVAAGQTSATVTVTTNAAATTATKSVILEASLVGGTTTLQAILNVQVVSVTISPAQVTLLVSRQQQFAATVTGTDNTAVVWSVQEGGGGSITPAGQYVAPGAVGTFHVVVTSVADPSKQAMATVNVSKIKDVKDKDKDVKDKEKEVRADKVGKDTKEVVREKIGDKLADKIADKRLEARNVAHLGPRPLLDPGVTGQGDDFIAERMQTGDGASGPLGQAFIRPEERPRVGAGLSKQGG